MRKLDFIIIGIMFLIATGVFFINRQGMNGELRVSVVSEGVKIKSMALPDTPMEIILENKHGRNTLRLTHDGAQVIWSSCPTRICIHTGKVTNSRQMIVCLPHHLIITLEGSEHGVDVDAVAR